MPSVADIALKGTLGCLLASLQGRDRQAQPRQSGGRCPSPRTAMRHGLSSQQRLTALCFAGWSPPDVTGAAGPHVCRHQARTRPHGRLSPGEGREHALPSSCCSSLELRIRNQSSATVPAGSVTPSPPGSTLAGRVGGRRDPPAAHAHLPSSHQHRAVHQHPHCIRREDLGHFWKKDAQATSLGKTGLQALQRKQTSLAL